MAFEGFWRETYFLQAEPDQNIISEFRDGYLIPDKLSG
jgi:hypothetical protein